MNTALFLMDVRHHFTAAEHARRTGGTYEAGEGSPAAKAISAAMRNMLAAGLTHAQALGALRDLARDVVRTVRQEEEDRHERMIEARMDALDRRLMSGRMTQAAYDAAVRAL